jgi:hypothetical protein
VVSPPVGFVLLSGLFSARKAAFTQMNEEDVLRRKLDELKIEHRDLDDVIDRLAHQLPFDQLKLQRLKKRKLMVKDLIAKVESQLLPDIIA